MALNAMILELSLIAVSGLGMITLLVHKNREESKGANIRVQEIRQRTDPLLLHVHQTTGRAISHLTIHNVVLIANYAFVYVVRFCMNVSRRVHDTSARIVDKASKKTEDLSRGGAASFYLKKIKEDRAKEQELGGTNIE